MKKRLLSFFMATAAVAVYAQPMFYVNDVDVKVEENTLVYIGGAFEKTSTVANNGVVTNDGNIFVNGDFTNASSEDFFLLTNKNGDNTTYGQLIIDDAATVSGKISLTRQLASNQDWIQMSFPFSDATGNSVLTDMGLATGVAAPRFVSCTPNTGRSCGARYRASFLYWVNNEALFETVSDGDAVLNPEFYYILNVDGRHTDAAGKLVTITGTPQASSVSVPTVPMSDLFDPSDQNKYNETYADYQEDIALGNTSASLNDTNWGENQYQFSNPYTSNLDISFIGFNETGTLYENDGNALTGIQAAAFANATSSGNGDATDRDSNVSTSRIAYSANGRQATGDVNTFPVLEPTIPFVLKFNGTNPSQALALGDPNKVFSDEARSVNDLNGTENKSASNSVGSSVNQVGVAIYNGEVNTGKRFYLAASDEFTDTTFSLMELGGDMPANGMYTIQEAADGSIRQDEANRPMFVNGVSNSFIGVAIPVGLNIDEDNPQTVYTLKTSFRSANGVVLDNGTEFDTGNNFIFHDKELGEIRVMDDSFEYTFTQTSDTNERFEIFYGEVPSFLNTLEPGITLSSTKVYKKDQQSYAIRFSADQLGERANVTVFNGIGQLISTTRSVKTDVDFNLNLGKTSSTLYVVRIEGENGTVVTQKIIK